MNEVRENSGADEKERRRLADCFIGMRKTSRETNKNISAPMDTAIVSGGAVGESVKIIVSKADELYNEISSASSASDEITANAQQFHKIIEKQNAALSETDSAIEAMSKSVNEMTEVTREKMASAGNLQEIIGKGGSDVMTTAKAIEEVTTAVNEVAEIIKVINGIAAQTNLLAMNAAIEAAHAGEMGKGFAVVAAEVRKLAENTTANSKAISSSLKNIIDQIKGAKTASENAGSSFTDIQNEVENFIGAFTGISRSTGELSAGTRQIVGSMGGLKQVSAEISGGSKEIAIGAENIDSALRKMKDFSTGLVSDMDAIEKRIYDISGAQSGMVQYIVDTNKNVENAYSALEEYGKLPKEETPFNYDLVVLMHQNWLVQLRAFLDDRKQNLKATAEDHLKCDLGKWIYGDGKWLSQSAAYTELEEHHKRFHGDARTIIQSKTQGNKKLAEEQYAKLIDDYHKVVSLLDILKKEKKA